MWNFLRPGRTGPGAVAALEGLLQELKRVQGSLPPDPVVAANSYLMWTEKAEECLLATFQGFAAPRQLHTDRYWRVRSMDSVTSRPMPLVHAEMRMQETYLRELLAQLKHYRSLLCLAPDHWLIVLDTNVYIHGYLFHEVEWRREIDVRRVTMAVPLVVLDELDRIKDRGGEFGTRAGRVLRALERVAKDGDWLNPIQLKREVWLQLVDEPLGHERRPGQDDEIVRQAVYFSQLNENRLILLTLDRGMRLRAQASGLTSRSLPEHLKRSRQQHE